MRSRLAVLPVLAVAAALVLAGCNNTTPGSPSTGQPSSNGSSSPSSSGNAASGTSQIKPCSLLTQAELSQYQLGRGKSATGSGARQCEWDNTTADNYAGYVIGASVRDHQGLKDINADGYTVTQDNIGNHQAKQLLGTSSGSCIVVIGVTDTSRVDVDADAGGGDATQSCQLANQFAKLIEPKLPGGS